MYEDKLKKELFEKIAAYNKTCDKWCEKYSHTEDEDEIEELGKNDPEFKRLLDKMISLEEEIDLLKVDTKYHLLTGLTERQIRDLGRAPSYWEVQELSTGKTKPILTNEKVIEKHLDMELLGAKEDMKQRIGKLKPLHLNADVDSRTRILYKQIANCFTYGFYDACCVLCRVVVELISKRYIEFKGLGELLTGKDKSAKKFSIQDILRNKLNITQDIIGFYSRISNTADKILHEKSTKVAEKDALRSIESLHDFIQRFPKTV